MGRPRNVGLLKGIIKKKVLIFMRFYVLFSFLKKSVCHILIYPLGLFAPFHKSDAGNSVYNAVIMAVVPFHLKQFRIVSSRRLPVEVALIIHVDRIVPIQTYYQ